MALNLIHDLQLIWNNDTDPGYNFAKTAEFTGFQREGDACIGTQVSNTLVEGWASTPTTIDFTANGGMALYGWMVSYGYLDIYTSGGYGIIVSDGTNRIAYYVGGRDRTGFVTAGWSCFMIDSNSPPPLYNVLAGAEASLNWAAVTELGYRFKTLAKSLGGAENCFMDVMRYGKGITLQGGTSASPANFFSASQEDLSTDAGKAYGIIREIQPNIYGVQGKLDIGDTGSNSSWFESQDDLIVWEDNWAGDNFYSTSIIGNSTGTNVVVFGQKIGTGDTALGANGCTFQSSGPDVRFNWSGSNMDVFDIYGTKFFKIESSELIQFSHSGSDFIGNSLDQCTQVTIGNSFVRNCTFSGTAATSASLLWSGNMDMMYCAFNNLSFSGNDFDVLSQYTGTLVINSTDSTVSSYTASSSPDGDVSIINNVFLTVNVEDGDAIAIESASVWIATDELAASRTVLMNEYTTGAGIAVANYNYLGDQEIILRIRKSSDGDIKYENVNAVGSIDNSGFETTIVMKMDINAIP